MQAFECCLNCAAPKRYPGCHGRCPEYEAARTAWLERKQASKPKDHDYRELIVSGIRKSKRRRGKK